jgi:3-deoxy-7-phosphoheptulonate synthase
MAAEATASAFLFQPTQIVAGSEDMTRNTSNLRVESIRPLTPPALLIEQLPLGDRAAATVSQAREQISAVLAGQDDRLIIVVGPCSIHDPAAGFDFARRLKDLTDQLAPELCVVMRVYFEKPRTTVGWKGLINDPHLNNSFDVNEGLYRARRLLLDLAELGLPAGCEFLDPISPQFFSDLVSWGAIGARTTESQVHRELASGLSMPVGFKNGTDGGVPIAVDAILAATQPHHFLGVTEHGLAGIVSTTGNRDCHLILRGGLSGSNYDADSVDRTLAALRAARLRQIVMIDTSHGNSGKDFRRQPAVAREVAAQVARGQAGIIGVMLESFLVEGRQNLTAGTPLVYGQSVTDACMSWEMAEPVLRELATAVRARRAQRGTTVPAEVAVSGAGPAGGVGNR